jgi:hypothetical protein
MMAQAGEESGAPRPGEICLACDQPVQGTDLLLIHRGRRVPLHRGACFDAWSRNPDAMFAALQPRGALFQEPEESMSPLRDAWFAFGAYVLLGLIFGAACAYTAVGRGHAPVRWFFAGLAVNAVALAILLARPRADLSNLPAGVPPGLRKVPTTRAGVPCPKCGSLNHPAARRCSSCGAALQPSVAAETARV